MMHEILPNATGGDIFFAIKKLPRENAGAALWG
jgi:hypothetical protein